MITPKPLKPNYAKRIRFKEGEHMRYEQAKPLVQKLMEIAIMYHASSLLREKIYNALDEFLPELDEGCRERGCIAVDDFKENT
jgi:hypothetical protein